VPDFVHRCTSAAAAIALLAVAVDPLSAFARSGEQPTSDEQLAFLSTSPDDETPADTTPAPENSTRAFDGRWTFTGAGCPNTGSVNAVIKSGTIIVKGGAGHVGADGTLHSVGAGGGMTLTAEGHLSADMGSGTFDRSDGCSGTWIAIKRRR
jgi:hypothetical protein